MYVIRLLLVLLLALVAKTTGQKEKPGNLCKTGFGSTLLFNNI